MGTGLSPLDDELGLLPGTLTPWLHERLVRLESWMPFAQAARELGALTRAPSGTLVSASAAERLAEAAGAAYVAEQAAAMAALEQHPTPEPAGPAVLQLSVDGAMVSLVHRQWVEVKTLAVGRVAQEPNGEVRAHEPSYFSRRTDAATFRRLALAETHRRGVTTADTVVAVQDGADWLQGFIDFHRRDAVRVLDFPHAVEYVARAGHEALGVGMAATDASKAWLATQAHALKHDGPAPVPAALRALPGGEHRDAALGYLEPRLAQLQYPAFRAQGYPIGSGLVEGANKVVVEARLKGSGKHCAPQSVDPMLAHRTIVCADRWREAWPQISARLRADAQARRHRLRAARRAAAQPAAHLPTSTPTATLLTDNAPPTMSTTPPPTTPKMIVDGRPTKAHPWNRRFLTRRPASPARN